MTTTLPTITVRIGFASDPFAEPQTWTDVSDLLYSYELGYGRNSLLDKVQTGWAKVVLKNDGNLWPDYAAGAYYPNIQPYKRINIRATWDGVTYDRFTGVMTNWLPGWQSEPYGAVMTLPCSDGLRNLNEFKITGAGYAQELGGARFGNVLDSMGWPAATRAIDTGNTTLKATGALAGVQASSHLDLVQRTEKGIIFVSPAGYMTFHDRAHRLKSPCTVSQATFSDLAADGRSYKKLEPTYDELIYNSATITRDGGTAQTASDAASIAAYGPHYFSDSGLLMLTDNEALSQAQYIVSRYKTPALNARGITVMPQLNPSDLYPKVLSYGISTRITLKLDQASLLKDYFIEGGTEFYSAQTGEFATTWKLSNIDNQAYWALGIAGFSELGETTKLFY